MPVSSTGGGCGGSSSGSASGSSGSPAPGAVTTPIPGGLLPADPGQSSSFGSVPTQPTPEQISTVLDTVEQTVTSAQQKADDCICGKLDKIAGSLDGLKGVVAELVVGALQKAVDTTRVVGTIAGSYAPTSASTGASGEAPATKPKALDVLFDAPADSGYVPGTDLERYAVGVIPDQAGKPAKGEPAPQPAFPPVPPMLLGGGEDDSKKKKKDEPKLETSPLGYSEPTPGKWSVWRNAAQCSVLVIAPDQAPLTGGFEFVQAYDDATKASEAAAAIRGGDADCVKEPERVQMPAAPSIWDKFKGCEQAAGQLTGVSPSDRIGFSTLVGLRNRKGLPVIPKDLKEFSIVGLEIGVLIGWVFRLVSDGVDLIVSALTGKLGGASGLASGYHVKAGMARFVERWTGINLPAAHVPDTYNGNFLDPQDLPSPDEAAALFGAALVDRDTAMCWGRANGRLPAPFSKSLDARLSVPDAFAALRLERMGAADAKKTDDRLRRNGWQSAGDRADLEKLSIPLPGMSDIIRLMVRDVTNETAIRKGDLDKGFEANWGGELSQWARAQGIPEELMKLFWLAHWNLPGPGQLMEAYHRFRNLPDKDKLKVTLPDIEQALEQQDIAPAWIPRILAMSFHPLTRVDAMRAYQLGSIRADQLRKTYTDLGYDDANADIMVLYTRNLIADRMMGTPAVKAFIRGEAEWPVTVKQLPALDTDKLLAQKVQANAEARRKVRRDAQCMAGIKQRFLRGEFDRPGAAAELAAFGIDNAVAAQAVEEWQCIRKAGDLRPTIATLGRWYGDGLINTQDIVDRLNRLGFTRLDARRIAETAFAAAQAKQVAAEEAAKRRMKGAAGKAAAGKRGEDNARKKQVQEADRVRKAEEKAADKREDTRRAAAAAYAKKSGLTADQAFIEVVQAYETALRICGPDCQEAATEAARLAVSAWKDGGQTLWQISSSLVKEPAAQNVA